MNTTGVAGDGPVTVSVARRVRPGREAQYEAWVRGITAAAARFPGHLGINVLRPSSLSDLRLIDCAGGTAVHMGPMFRYIDPLCA
jgi:antibiotic biosynthesis monooxygenase (ABM) superfamily enzyme